MKVTRKLMRKFTYVSVGGSTIGTVTVEKVTSEELPDWKVYQFEHKESVRTEESGFFEGSVEKVTTIVRDYPTYSLALEAIAFIESRYSNSHYRTNTVMADGRELINGTPKAGAQND